MFASVLRYTVSVRNFFANLTWAANCTSFGFTTVLCDTVCVRNLFAYSFAASVRAFFLYWTANPTLAGLWTAVAAVASDGVAVGINTTSVAANSVLFPVPLLNSDHTSLLNGNLS